MLSGCTPLHWAALRGNVEACTVLVHAGTKQELTVKDKAGFTPVQLASDKGHRHVALFLVRNFILMLCLVGCMQINFKLSPIKFSAFKDLRPEGQQCYG